jgi:hypothetical protein
MTRKLKLPITLRTPELKEWTFDQGVSKQIEESFLANIVEGLVIQYPEEERPFNFSSEINVNSDKFWAVFKALALDLPESMALIYHHIDEQPKYGEYRDKYEILNILESYRDELSNDAYLKYGLISNSESSLEEIFISENKWIQFWGIDESKFLNTMAKFDIYPEKNLNFIDEYPVQRTVLSHFSPDCIDTTALIGILENEFGNEQLL